MKAIFICGVGRSGNTLLNDLLEGTGYARSNRKQIDHIIDSKERLIPDLLVLDGNPPVVYSYIHDFRRFELLANEPYFKDLKFVFIQRKDKIAQSISHMRAGATGVWHLKENSSAEMIHANQRNIDLSEDEILRSTIRFFFADLSWHSYFKDKGLSFHHLFYEDLIDASKQEGEIAKILDYADINYDLPLTLKTKTKITRSQTSREVLPQWVNFLEKSWDSTYLPFE